MLIFAASFTTTFAIFIVCYFLWPRFRPLAMEKYPNAMPRIENGSFKGSTTPTHPRPPVPGYPASTQKD